MSRKDDYEKTLVDQAKDLSQEQLMKNARAVAMVRRTVEHALVYLGEEVNPPNINLFMFGAGVQGLLMDGMAPDNLRDLFEANLAASGAQRSAASDAAVKHVAGKEPEN